MKRLLILLLICLLPVQVFAGTVSYAEEHLEQIEQRTIIEEVLESVLSVASHIDLADETDEQEHDEYLMHIGAGDEPVIYAGSFAAPDFPAFFPVCRSDLALQPPFLPPAGRPPRV
jgi:hypothetical protein